jgi:phospholipid transport system substrate-binding protein
LEVAMTALARSLRAGAVALVAVFILSATATAQTPSMSAKDFVQKVGNEAIRSLTDKSVPDSERVKRMRAFLRDNFNEAAISKFVLGTYWNRASEEQRAEFQKLYETVVAHNYAGLFKKYSGETFQVLGQRGDEDAIIVNAQINQTNGGPPIPVELQVQKDGSVWRAVDIKVDGVSMPQTHRKEYSSVINRSRNGVDGLLEALRTKAKQLEDENPSQ